jgi:L,D-transpeptidase ErfK/SrfK
MLTAALLLAWCVPPLPSPDAVWLDLNIPAYRLELFSGTTMLARYSVAPGAPDFRTPRGRFEVDRIEWNPWWIPPDSPWARDERPTPPGPDNPMGRVKLYFRPLYFLHGTPYEQSIGTAASHGCVRMHNESAVALALELLRLGGSPFDADSADAALASGRTRTIDLPRAVPLHVRYDLVEVREDSLLVHRDIYRLGRATRASTLAALALAGVDTLDVDAARVADVVRRAARATQRVPLTAIRRARHDAPQAGGHHDGHARPTADSRAEPPRL